ncbi:MAG: hypothetical protein ACO2PN_03700 [Pyrobaculum sp.]
MFDWSRVVGLRMTLTLEEPKLQVIVEAPLDRIDEAIRRSVEGGWLRMLSDKEGLEDLMYVKSWDDLKQWVADHWDVVVEVAVSRLREVLKEEELRRLLAPEGGDVAKRRKGGQVAPRDMQKDGENVWEELERRLKALRDMLNDDKIAREVVAPAPPAYSGGEAGRKRDDAEVLCRGGLRRNRRRRIRVSGTERSWFNQRQARSRPARGGRPSGVRH